MSAKNFEIDLNPQKVGSKPERCERVYKRAAQAQRDFLRKRRSDGVSEPMTFQKKSRRERYIVRDDVVPVAGVEPAPCRQDRILSFTLYSVTESI